MVFRVILLLAIIIKFLGVFISYRCNSLSIKKNIYNGLKYIKIIKIFEFIIILKMRNLKEFNLLLFIKLIFFFEVDN